MMMRYIVLVLAFISFLCVKAQDESDVIIDETRIGDVVIPAGQTSIPDSAYYKNTEMTSLTIPASVEKIGSNVVDHCFKLVYITVDAENPNFKSVGGVVYSKDGKTLILCPPGKTGEFTIPAQATMIAPYAFRTCRKLTSIVLPNGNI